MAVSNKRSKRPRTTVDTTEELETIKENSVKRFAAKLYLVMEKEGFNQAEFRSLVSRAGYKLQESTFRNWLVQTKEHDRVGVLEKMSGNKQKLTHYQRLVLSGYVFHFNSEGIPFHLEDYVSGCSTIFELDISPATASRYLRKDGLVSKSMKTKTAGFHQTQEELNKIFWNWIVKGREDGLLKGRRSHVCSIDFTYTSHRTTKVKTYSPSAVAPPKCKEGFVNYTNCIITCIWADGENRTPAVLFTHNPKFRKWDTITTNRAKNAQELALCLVKYSIDRPRIVYIKPSSTGSKTYVKESPELLRKFFSIYQLPHKKTIFSDKGNAFVDNQSDVLTELGFENHRTYPPPVHHCLSPNDNMLHGAAKKIWREKCKSFEDDLDASCLLLNLLDQQTILHSKTWFDRNMFKVTELGVEEVFHECSEEKLAWIEYCKNLYYDSQGADLHVGQEKIPKELRDTLDGPYFRT